MKLDRNIEGNEGRGKYALLNLRKMPPGYTYFGAMKPGFIPTGIYNALRTLENAGILDWGVTKSESEFFVIRLKDRYAGLALFAYAKAALDDGNKEWGEEVRALAVRAGPVHPNCKRPD